MCFRHPAGVATQLHTLNQFTTLSCCAKGLSLSWLFHWLAESQHRAPHPSVGPRQKCFNCPSQWSCRTLFPELPRTALNLPSSLPCRVVGVINMQLCARARPNNIVLDIPERRNFSLPSSHQHKPQSHSIPVRGFRLQQHCHKIFL